MSIQDVVRRLQALEPAWFSRNSWLNELVGGALGTALLAILVGPVMAFLLFQIISVGYEASIDPWGWNLDDVMERALGSLAVALVWWLI